MTFDLDRYKKIKSVLKKNREKANKVKAERPFYRVDRSNASDYLRGHPKLQRIIDKYFYERRILGLPTIYADICGEAIATSMGATHNYNFSIKEGYFKSADTTQFKGDIFNKQDVLDFVNKIKVNGHKLNYITFEPIVGLEGYDFSKEKEDRELHRKVVWQQLENNLTLLLEVLEPGGYMYISKSFQLGKGLVDFLQSKKQNQYEMAIDMKKFARRNKLRIKIEPSIRGPLFLLHKPVK
jgi:hypothetical protein